MLTYRRSRGLGLKAGSTTIVCAGDSLSDTQVSVSGIFQGGWGNTLATRYGLTRLSAGGTPQTATIGAPTTSGSSPNIHIVSIPVTGFGWGYAKPPNITFTLGTFSVAAAAHTLLGSGGRPAQVVMDNQGTYSVLPTITIDPVITANNTVSWVPVASAYTSASATGTTFSGGITGVTGLVAGGGYPTQGASVTFTGGGGTGAYADSCTTAGAGTGIVSLDGLPRGTGYVSSSTVAFSNGNDWSRAAIQGTTLIHRATAGAYAALVDSYQTRIIPPSGLADVVTIWIGTNDYAVCGTTTEAATGFSTVNPLAFYTAYTTVVQAVKASGNDPLVVLLGLGPLANRLGTNPPTGSLWSAATYPTGLTGQALTSGAAVLAEFNGAISRVAYENRCVYVPMDRLDLVRMGVTAGDIHLNSTGQQFVADRVQEAIGGG